MCIVCDDAIDIENKLFSGFSEKLNGFVDKLSKIADTKTRFSKSYFKEVADILRSGIEKPNKVTIEYNVANVAKQSYMEANVFRFSAAKTTSMVQDMNKILRTQQRSSDFREFKKAVDDLKISYNKHWLETEYQLTQSVSRNSARHARFIDELDVFQFVKYKTINDDRVRDWHKVLHNTIVKIGSAEYDLISPPNGFRCRCEFVQVEPTPAELKTLSSERDIVATLSAEPYTRTKTAYEYMTENGFDRNRAKSGVIFDESRMYISSFNEAGLNYKDYGLENYQQFKQANPRIRNAAEETANFKRDYRDVLIETDYTKYDVRTLRQPAEVWMIYNDDKDVYTKKYIRDNEVIIIELSNSSEKIIGAKALDDAGIDKIRKGVLIYG